MIASSRAHTQRSAALIAILAGAVAACVPPAACAQPAAQTSSVMNRDEEAKPEQVMEAYLERLGLKRLLAEHLEMQLARLPKDQRTPAAERLSKLYAELLTDEPSADVRKEYEDKARQLLSLVPDADSADLRLNLLRAVYAREEDVAERRRLRLVDAEAAGASERQLRSLAQQFAEIGNRVARKVETLERVEQSGEANDKSIADLADARRVRSLAFYYAAWSNYYVALLSHTEQPAAEAQRQFGWLLNSPGNRAPTLDRVNASNFQLEHVARAALGVSLAASLRGNDVEAVRWLDAIGEAEDKLSPALKEQLNVRRMAVFGAAKRWSDLEFLVRRLRRPAEKTSKEPTPLKPAVARLLAVITLEADKSRAGPQIEGLARIALGDLVAEKQVAQVLDLVQRYGTAPIGDAGFVVHYARALALYDQARKTHQALGPESDEPTTDSAAINQYNAAGQMFELASQQTDAEEFPLERARAAVMLGRSQFFAGQFAQAAESFTKAFGLTGPTPAGEEPLWLSVVSFDRLLRSGQTSASATRQLGEAVTLFLRTYPDSDKAPRMVLIQAASGNMNDDEAIRVLSSVGKDAPMYEASRRQLSRLLYQKFRTERGEAREFAATRFVSVSEDVLAMDRKAAVDGRGAEQNAAADRVITRARQMLDALLSTQSPDAARAESVLQLLHGVAAQLNVDLSQYQAELTFRRLQIALGKDDLSAASEMVDSLQTMMDKTGQFAPAAERLLYRKIAAKWTPGSTDLDAARRVVTYGLRIIDRLSGSGREQLKDPAVLALHSTVSAAALDLFKAQGETGMRDLSMRLDKLVLSVQPGAEPVLMRLAESAESAGDLATAIGCWSTLQQGSPVGSEKWMRARYECVRLLITLDIDKARDTMSQHRALYADFGPEPWGSKLRELDAKIPPAPVRTPAASPVQGAAGGAP